MLGVGMNLAIVGVGLIGGSFALGVKRANPNCHVIGIDRDPMALEIGLRLGVIDEAATLASVARCDVVMIAVPVRQYPAVLSEAQSHLGSRTVLTDAGSTKRDVIETAREILGDKIALFVPGHPLAGREHAGVAAADQALFAKKRVALTPLAENSRESVDLIAAMWRTCGANVVHMTPDTHDAVFAAVSHLPHLLAFALVDDLAARANAKNLFSFAASGFRDFTRIAGSNPEMWKDIALNNRDALLEELAAYEAKLGELRRALTAEDGDALEALMTRAKQARDNWMAGDLAGFRDEAS